MYWPNDSAASQEDLPHSQNLRTPHFICVTWDKDGICSYGYISTDPNVARRSELDESENPSWGARCRSRNEDRTCKDWELAGDAVERDSGNIEQPPVNGINVGDPGQQRPSLVLHGSILAALQMQHPDKECSDKNGEWSISVFNLWNGMNDY
jgi:hypothetical protein